VNGFHRRQLFYFCFNGASNTKKIHANQEMKMTARIQASFSPPLTLFDASMMMNGKNQMKMIPIMAKKPRPANIPPIFVLVCWFFKFNKSGGIWNMEKGISKK